LYTIDVVAILRNSTLSKTAGRKRLRQALRLALLDLIVTGKLKGGERINESRISRLLKASRTPLREALLQLEKEGLVRSDLRRGFTVEPLSSREVREIYPILAQLECLAVRGSARFVATVLPELTRINADFARTRTAKRALEQDTLWHNTLMSQSKNARLAALIATLRLAIRRYEHFYMADSKLIPTSVAQHQDIIAAFQGNDLEAGIKAIEENYVFGMQVLLRKMGEE
jgi:DNA-binding GntR family transcriptional regulator